MAATLKMPLPSAPYTARSGTVYTSGATGLITGVVGLDIVDMIELGGYTQPPAGTGTATIPPVGNLVANSYAGTSLQPASTGADVVLAVFPLPAGSLSGHSANAQRILVTAQGVLGATANAKDVKLFFNPSTAVVGSAITGGTLISDSGSSTQSGVGWQLSGSVVKTGIAGSNTQVVQRTAAVVGAVSAGVGVPAATTANEAAPIFVAVTGNAGTATTDISLNFFSVEFQE